MKILLTNDDSIYAQGIESLAQILYKKNHQLAVVAPDSEKSASGHSISLHRPLRAELINLSNSNLKDVTSYKVDGTPADCVKLGVDTLIKFDPDLIISGINHGGNLGYDVLYSGTVSAAIEGWMMGYTSIALSLNIEKNYFFEEASLMFTEVILPEVEEFIKNKMLLNINIPDLKRENMNEICITRLSKCLYDDYYENRKDPMGNNYYWLKGNLGEEVEEGSDIWALNQNKISITPLEINLSSEKGIEILKKMDFQV